MNLLHKLAPRRASRTIRGRRIFLLTNGGPNGSTEVLMTLVYQLGFEHIQLGVAGEFRIFWSVVLPTVTPALGVIDVFGFTMIWDQYLLPLLVASGAETCTLPLALSSLRAGPEVGMGIVLVAAALAMLRSIIAFPAFQRSFMRGISAGAIKG